MYSFVPPFREAIFCGVPSCVFEKLGCAAGEENLRNTDVTNLLVSMRLFDVLLCGCLCVGCF
jgi:hypothetical protein